MGPETYPASPPVRPLRGAAAPLRKALHLSLHRNGIRDLLHAYCERHPAERHVLQPVLRALDAPDDPTSAATFPGRITCSAVVIDHARRVLHIRREATGQSLLPGDRAGTGDRTLLGAALRGVCGQAGIKPFDLCHTPQLLGTPIDLEVHDLNVHNADSHDVNMHDVDTQAGDAHGDKTRPAGSRPARPHLDVRFAFYLAHGHLTTAVRDEEVTTAEWRPFEDVDSPTLRAKLLASSLDGKVEPVNASALIFDDTGRYLLHLRDNFPDIWEPGSFALLGGGREPQDPSLEDTLRRELAEEVPDLCLPVLEPLVVEEATGTDGLCVPVQVFAGRWNGDPEQLRLTEGLLLRWFPPGMLHRLRLSASTRALLDRHAASLPSTESHPPSLPPGGRTVPNVIGVHLYLEDAEGRVLLGLRHPDSAYAGENWHFLAGHCEQESAVGCLVRVAFEEAGLVIDPDDVEFVHAVHLVDGPGEQPRLQLVFRAQSWKGDPEVREPDKCLAWQWWRPENLPEPIVSYARTAIDGIRGGRRYSEIGW